MKKNESDKIGGGKEAPNCHLARLLNRKIPNLGMMRDKNVRRGKLVNKALVEKPPGKNNR